MDVFLPSVVYFKCIDSVYSFVCSRPQCILIQLIQLIGGDNFVIRRLLRCDLAAAILLHMFPE